MRIKWVTVCIDGLCWDFPGWPWHSLVSDAELPAKVEEQTGHYAKLFSDASIVQGIHLAAQNISDSGTRTALETGIASAVKAMEKRGGAGKVKITLG
jgi:hypothetical protein